MEEEEQTEIPLTRPPCFPCIEQPPRSVIRHGDRFLRSDKKGNVISSTWRSTEQEEFVLLPVQEKSYVVMVMNHKYKRYLVTHDRTGQVSTIDEENLVEGRAHWCLQREVATDRVMLTSLYNGQTLVCNAEGVVQTSATPDSNQACWSIDSVTGELCFLSLPRTDQRLRCDLMGYLTMSENWKGWEVWRFMESTDGYVRITSWMHSQHLLCCTSDGIATTCTFAKAAANPDFDTEWAIFKAKGGNGVSLRSRKHGQSLNVGPDGSLFSMLAEDDAEVPVWQIEAAHRQVYSLCTGTGEASVGPFPFVTSNLKQSDEWVVEHREQGVVAFCSVESSDYICSTNDGGTLLRQKPDDGAELWVMEMAPTGSGHTLQSKPHGFYLTYKEGDATSGRLVCSTDTTDVSNQIWSLSPSMPRAVSSSKIKTFAIGTSLAIGTTVAMPFAMAGVMGILGAVGAEVGIVANVVTVGLTGAEAIASVGVIGATAAIVFRESSDSLTMDNEEEKKSENTFSKRPFCAWRSW